MVETPVHQQWQQRHCDKNDNCHCNNGKDTCALTATMPSQQGQQCQLDDKQQGQQRRRVHTRKQQYHMFVFAHTLANIPMFKLAIHLANLANLCCGQAHDT
jgi:hypothetical protein